jgi:hypothetical protein
MRSSPRGRAAKSYCTLFCSGVYWSGNTRFCLSASDGMSHHETDRPSTGGFCLKLRRRGPGGGRARMYTRQNDAGRAEGLREYPQILKPSCVRMTCRLLD